MIAPGTPGNSANQPNLNVLVSAIQNAVQAQNLIATNISKVTTALTNAFPLPTVQSQAWTPGGIANGASAAISFAVTGVTLGQFVKASLAEDMLGCSLSGYVQSANTVEAVIQNATGATVTFAATTVKVSVASS